MQKSKFTIWIVTIFLVIAIVLLALIVVPKLLHEKKLTKTIFHYDSLEDAEKQDVDFQEYPGSRLVFDKDGVRLTPFDAQAADLRYSPTSITHYALSAWNSYLDTDKESSKEKFLNQVKWLVDNKKQVKDAYVWEYSWDVDAFTLKAPWVSALSQGETISVMLRAFQITGDNNYLEIAKGAFNSFKLSTADGGVKATDKFWFEEYPNSSKTHVLNGFMYSLAGIREYWEVTHKWDARWYWERATRSLAKNLSQYDAGFDSTYDVSRPIQTQYKFYLLGGNQSNLESITFLNGSQELTKITLEEIKNSSFNLPLRSLIGTNELPEDFNLKAKFTFRVPEEIKLRIYIERGNQVVDVDKTSKTGANVQVMEIPDRFYSRTYSGAHYNRVVADQLQVLSELTNKKILQKYNQIFNQYPQEQKVGENAKP